MTEIEKAEETIRWLNLFDIMRANALFSAINISTFDANLKASIDRMRKSCENIINPPIEQPKLKYTQRKPRKSK